MLCHHSGKAADCRASLPLLCLSAHGVALSELMVARARYSLTNALSRGAKRRRDPGATRRATVGSLRQTKEAASLERDSFRDRNRVSI
jgi:hypothetical protein